MKPSKYLAALLMSALVLMACSKQAAVPAPSPAPPSAFTTAFSAFDAGTATMLTEIARLTASGHGGPVVEVGYAPDTNRVLVVYLDDGYVVGWDMAAAEVAVEYELDITSSKALSFSASGAKLMGATEHIFKPDRLNGTIEYVNGIALWDMESGELIDCISYPCQGNTSSRDGYAGASIDSTGRWVFTYSGGVVGVSDLSGASGGRISGINDLDSDYLWTIGAIAFDAVHERFAIILQEGGIWLDNIEASFWPYHVLTEGTKNDLHDVLAAEFDVSGRWLAILRNDRLSVWQMEKEQLLLEDAMPNAVDLAFDQTGELLIVAANDQIVIWEVENKNKIAEYDAPGIASLAISDDNRLLIWGDTEGQAHIWAAPSP